MKTAADIKNAEDLIRYAFACRAIRLNAQGSFEQASRGTNPAEITAQDRITEGVMIYGRIMEGQGKMSSAAIIAAHSRDAKEQDEAIKTLGQQCATVIKMPVWCAIDGAYWWANGEFRHVKDTARDYGWWADHLGRSYSTVHRWWRHPKTETKSIRSVCSGHYQAALDRAEESLTRAGLLD